MDYQYEDKNKKALIEENTDKNNEYKDFKNKKRVVSYASKITKKSKNIKK